MSLRLRLLLILAGVALTSILVIVGAFGAIQLNQLAQVERGQSIVYVEFAEDLLFLEVERLGSVAAAWGASEEAVRFAVGDRSSFFAAYSANLFETTNVDFLIFADDDGQIIYSNEFAPGTGEALPLPADVEAAIAERGLLSMDSANPQTGFLTLPSREDVILVASAPILQQGLSSLVYGKVIIGHSVTSDDLAQVTDYTDGGQVALFSVSAEAWPQEIAAVRTDLLTLPDNLVEVVSQTRLNVYEIFPDISGQPSIVLRIQLERTLYQQGLGVIARNLAALSVILAVQVALLGLILERGVVRRLTRLSTLVQALPVEAGSLTAQIPVQGRDEISRVGVTINTLLERIAQSRSAQAASDESLRRLLAHIPDIVVQVDRAGHIQFVHHPAARTFTQLTPESMVGVNFFDFLPREQHAMVRAVLDKTFDEGVISEYEIIAIDPEHLTDAWYLTRAAPLMENGRVSSAILISTDITQRKSAEESLAAEQSLMRLLMDSIPDTIYFKDMNSRFTRINRAQVAMMRQQTEADVLGKSDFDFQPEHLAKEFFAEEQQLMQTGEPILDRLEYNPRPDGTPRWLSATKIPLKDAQGNILGMVGLSRDITERKLAESALAESERQYRDLFENTSDLIQSVDSTGHHLYVNKAWLDKLGYSQEELSGLRFIDVVHPDERDHCETTFAHLMAGEAVETLDTRFVTKTGEIISVEGNLSTRFEEGKPPATRGIFRDVTARRRAETALRESQERLERVLNAAPIILAVVNPEGLLTLSTGSGLAKLGLAPHEAEGQSVEDLYGAYPDILDSVNRSLAGEEVATVVQINDLSLEVLLTPLRDEHGSLTGSLVIALDVTEKQKNVIALRESEERFRQMADNINDVFWMNDLELGRMSYVSPAYERLTGRSVETLYENPIHFLDAVHEEDRGLLMAAIMNGIHQPYTVTYRVVHVDGSIRWVQDTSYPLLNEAGVVYRAVGVTHNITEEVEAQSRIQEQNTALQRANEELIIARRLADEGSRLKSQFLATMSHELRTPLNAIIGYTEIQLAGMSGPMNDEQLHYEERVLVNAKDLLRLINEILDLSKIEAGRMELAPRLFAVRPWVSEIIDQMSVLAEEKGLDVQVEIDDRLPSQIVGDSARLKQITLNLLSNAIKFTEQGSVRLILRKHGLDAWQVEVVDTGVGIPPHMHETIFDEFRQIDSTSHRRYSGTGLGLAIVRKLAMMMGGNIRVNSQLGQGSTFVVTLPLSIKEPRLEEMG